MITWHDVDNEDFKLFLAVNEACNNGFKYILSFDENDNMFEQFWASNSNPPEYMCWVIVALYGEYGTMHNKAKKASTLSKIRKMFPHDKVAKLINEKVSLYRTCITFAEDIVENR